MKAGTVSVIIAVALVATAPPVIAAFAPAGRRAALGVPKFPGGVLNELDKTLPTALYFRSLQDDNDTTTDDNISNDLSARLQSKTPSFGYNYQDSWRRQNAITGSNGGLNKPLIRALLLNQVLILGLATAVCSGTFFLTQGGLDAFGHLNDIPDWTNGDDFHNIWDLELTPARLVWGVGGVLPLLALNYVVEQSDKRVFSNVNFSTISMVMTLFGRRKSPELAQKNVPTTTFQALTQSVLLSGVTGLCEETVFRRELPAVLLGSTGGNVPLTFAVQALLFGLGHANPKSSIGQNAVIVGLQVFNGLGFGAIYAMSGGSLAAAVAAHTTFDLVNFFKTWMDANKQLEYAERQMQEPLDAGTQAQLATARLTNPKVFDNVRRLFYLFDNDQNGELDVSEVRRGISYLAVERAMTPPAEAVIDDLIAQVLREKQGKGASKGQQRLSLTDFVQLTMKMSGGNGSGGMKNGSRATTNRQAKKLIGV